MELNVTDQHGNLATIAYWGSEEAARASLATLKYCKNCLNCSGCSGCSNCSDCSGCSGCSGCSADPDAPAFSGPPPVPIIPDIHKAVYAAASNPRALNMDSVHTCANTHCRGGWVVTLAGAEGAALEAFYYWELAAMLIYDASAPGFKINPARFYDRDEAALNDMRKLAEEAN